MVACVHNFIGFRVEASRLVGQQRRVDLSDNKGQETYVFPLPRLCASVGLSFKPLLIGFNNEMVHTHEKFIMEHVHSAHFFFTC